MSAPASTCGHCCKEGRVSDDQATHSGNDRFTRRIALVSRMRFHCACGNEWLVDATEAETHGRFLEKARLR